MKEKLKKKPVIFLALLFTVLLIGGTVAYYYSDVVLPNEFQTMTYDVKIREEDFDGNFGSKRVYIVNEESTNTPVVLRISYNEYWEEIATGNILNNKDESGVDYVTKNWTSAFLNDFVLGSDGWYYYKKILKPQSEVQILENISRDTFHYSSKYHLDFYFEAIQANSDAIYEIWGRSAGINGDNVSWGF